MAGAAAISAGIPMSPCGLLPSTLPSFHLSPFSGPFYSLFFILTLFTSTGLGVSVSGSLLCCCSTIPHFSPPCVSCCVNCGPSLSLSCALPGYLVPFSGCLILAGPYCPISALPPSPSAPPPHPAR